MKNIKFLTFITTTLLFSTLLIVNCTKTGPQGPEGPAGPAGEDGINGSDGTAGCIQCHDGGINQGMFSRVNQWENSIHATGGNYARNSSSCARCHTSQGFLEFIETGDVAEEIVNPNPINCYTCHNIHDTYTPADLAFTTTEIVTAMVGGDSFNLGKGNLCVNCHQARTISNAPTAIDGEDVVLTHYRYGGHHGPQYNVLIGTGFYEFEGDESYGAAQQHGKNAGLVNGCINCHMADPYGVEAGGHTFNVTDDDGDVWTKGCLTCHADSDEVEAKVEDVQTEVQELLEALAELLIAQGMMDDGTYGHAGYAAYESGNTALNTKSAKLAAAFINWQMAEEDRSLGVHNPIYIKALLKNTIAAITP